MVDEGKAEKETDAGGEALETVPRKREIFARLPRTLTPKQMATSTAQVFMVNEIERLEAEISELKDFRNSYYLADKERAILTKKLDVANSKHSLFDVCLAVGAAMIGIAPGFWTSRPFAQIVLFFGCCLFLVVVGGKYAMFGILKPLFGMFSRPRRGSEQT